MTTTTTNLDTNFSNEYYLGVNIFILCLQTLSIIGNSLVIFLFARSKRIRSNESLKLVFKLSITDWIFAVLNLPHIIYLIYDWVPGNLFYYSPIFTVVSDIPLIVQIKINLLLTLCIALDRLQAIRFPIYYRSKNYIFYSRLFFYGGILWGSVDSVLVIGLTSIEKHFAPNDQCAAAGCFTSNHFKTYWAFCNTLLGAMGVILTLFFAIELRQLQKKNREMHLQQHKTEDDKKLDQANKLSMGILLNSTIFLMLPSAIIGIFNVASFSIFQQLGPFYSFVLLAAGFTNSIVYLTFHAELRHEARRLIKYKIIRVRSNSIQPQNPLDIEQRRYSSPNESSPSK